MTVPLSLYLFSFYISSRDNGHLANPQHSALSAAADKKRRERKSQLSARRSQQFSWATLRKQGKLLSWVHS